MKGPRAPLTPAIPTLPGGTPQNPSGKLPGLPDFSGAIKAFGDQWGGMVQVGLGAMIVLVGGAVLVLSTNTGRQGARAGLAAAGPWGRIASAIV